MHEAGDAGDCAEQCSDLYDERLCGGDEEA